MRPAKLTFLAPRSQPGLQASIAGGFELQPIYSVLQGGPPIV